MIKNILKKIKENFKILITFIIIFILFTMPLSYYIETPGGIIDARLGSITKRRSGS